MAGMGQGTVLIAAPTPAIQTTMRSALPAEIGHVYTVSSMTLALQKIQREPVDLLMIYSPLTDSPGIREAIELAQSRNIGILLLVKADVYDQVQYRAASAGIFVLARPTTRQAIAQTIGVLLSSQQKVRKLENENALLRRKLDDLRIVSRAKCVLVEKKHMTEEEAHRYIEKLAMDSCITKREAAQDLIRRLDHFP